MPMAAGRRPRTRRCKMRHRISGMMGGAKLCNAGDGGKLNHSDRKIRSHGEIDREVDAVKRPIGRGGVRINIHGDLYVPDSEEEDSDMIVEADARPYQIRLADAHPWRIRLADTRPCKIRFADASPCTIHGVKLGSSNDVEKVRGELDVGKCCLSRGRLRMDTHGIPYVLDSEEEDSGSEVQAISVEAVADLPAGMDVDEQAPSVHTAASLQVAEATSAASELASDMAADAVQLATEGSLGAVQVAAKKAAEIAATMKLTPEVQARLEAVLTNMDPLFHDVFVSMYKILELVN